MKQVTSIISISHCIKQIIAVCVGFVYKEIKNINNNPQGELFFLTQLWLLHSQEIPHL
jgi:hypothetical protein